MDKLSSDGDFCGSSSSEKYVTNLLELSDRCFIYDDNLLGYETDNMILFINSKSVGRTTYQNYDSDYIETGKYFLQKK